MSVYISEEGSISLPVRDYDKIAEDVMNAVLQKLNCPFDAEADLLLTTNDEIRQINKDSRGLDSPTDVLSFPFIEFDHAGDFTCIDSNDQFMFNPESGKLLLGDIVISKEKIIAQAEEYGHSLLREYAFLLVHSFLHLSGYDHMEDEDRMIMEKLQEDILKGLDISR